MRVATPRIHPEPEAPFRCEPPASFSTASTSVDVAVDAQHAVPAAGRLLPRTLAEWLGTARSVTGEVERQLDHPLAASRRPAGRSFPGSVSCAGAPPGGG